MNPNWCSPDVKAIIVPSKFTSSSTLCVSPNFILLDDSLFLIIIVGENLFFALLNPENLIDWPYLLSIKLSPSYNFNLCIFG